jgi:hypothetical protein
VWVIKIHAEFHYRVGFARLGESADGISLDVIMAASLICHYLATGQREQCAALVNLLLKAFDFPQTILGDYWDERHFEPFAMQLYQRETNVEMPKVVMERDLGPYQKVFDNWHDEDGLAGALFDICEYHCRRMVHDDEFWRPEFISPPFHLVPSEILGIVKVRERLGLSTPAIRHPLLETGLEKMPPISCARVSDDVLARVAAVAAKLGIA